MQNRKNDQFSMCFWTPVSFPFTIENLLLQIQIAKRLFKVIAGENCARQVRLLRFLLMQKFEKNQQKINILQLWGHLKTLKFLINFCTILEVLLQSNFLLLLCSKRKTKIFFTPPYHACLGQPQIWSVSYLPASTVLKNCPVFPSLLFTAGPDFVIEI